MVFVAILDSIPGAAGYRYHHHRPWGARPNNRPWSTGKSKGNGKLIPFGDVFTLAQGVKQKVAAQKEAVRTLEEMKRQVAAFAHN